MDEFSLITTVLLIESTEKLTFVEEKIGEYAILELSPPSLEGSVAQVFSSFLNAISNIYFFGDGGQHEIPRLKDTIKNTGIVNNLYTIEIA